MTVSHSVRTGGDREDGKGVRGWLLDELCSRQMACTSQMLGFSRASPSQYYGRSLEGSFIGLKFDNNEED